MKKVKEKELKLSEIEDPADKLDKAITMIRDACSYLDRVELEEKTYTKYDNSYSEAASIVNYKIESYYKELER